MISTLLYNVFVAASWFLRILSDAMFVYCLLTWFAPRSASRFGSLEEGGERYDDAPQRASSRSGAYRQRTVMFTLHNLEDCCDVIDNLILNNTVVLTLDDLDAHLMQRAVDTLSGAVFALHATIRKASDKTYLIAPSGVEVNETYDVDRRF